ncbi:MAG TPA: DNA adenine methylase [Bryobacteraceae bacterium]|jgi:DNA adenine methylase/adenine-specific DNA-methyltransferase
MIDPVVPFPSSTGEFASTEAIVRAKRFPQLRYMGSKHRLLPWIGEALAGISFKSALDAFSGSGSVAYLLKAMGKQVVANDFLNFPFQIAMATIENSRVKLNDAQCAMLLENNRKRGRFIQGTFKGIFFNAEDLRFLDNTWANLAMLPSDMHRALALAALVRSCIKRQPRGVFTVAGDPEKYKDGRRDESLPLKQHFLENVAAYNAVVFDNGCRNRATRSDIMAAETEVDLVYMDPPYVPRADDNCYVKRYHFLEGLASYWKDAGTEIVESSQVRKIPKRYTPFSYRSTAAEGFRSMLARFRESTLVLSYSSNGYPDLPVLTEIMQRYKRTVDVLERDHRYHFGTHDKVASERASVREYLIIGQGTR